MHIEIFRWVAYWLLFLFLCGQTVGFFLRLDLFLGLFANFAFFLLVCYGENSR
jgi:hypothetical protein